MEEKKEAGEVYGMDPWGRVLLRRTGKQGDQGNRGGKQRLRIGVFV